MIDLPPAPPAHGAGLLVAGVVYWSVIIGLILLAICTYQYVSYAPPTPAVCVVSSSHNCPVQGVGVEYTAYWVEWNKSVGLASPTPHYGGTP
jgi:hypothetical protein